MRAIVGKRTGLLVIGSTLISLILVGYTTETVENGGTIRGTVTLQGSPPAQPAHRVTDATQVPACGRSVDNDEVITGRGGKLANAVVWIDGIEHGKAPRRGRLTLGQVGCRFEPRIQAATRGSRLTVTSSDATLHNVHAKQGRRTAFNLAMPTKGVRINRTLNRPGLIEVNCDAGHTWMHASIHVFDHPYFAVTTRNGTFELPDVPPGRHTVKVWHERYGTQTRQLNVSAGGTATWEVQVR